MPESDSTEIVVGTVSGAYGIKGWVRIFSLTDPPEQILSYPDWHLRKPRLEIGVTVLDARVNGKKIQVRLEEVEDRTAAEQLKGAEIRVSRDHLAELAPGEFYWHQLEGMKVTNLEMEVLGAVSHLLETGGSDVLVVKGSPDSIDDKQRLIPFVEPEIVKAVDLDKAMITVNWAQDY